MSARKLPTVLVGFGRAADGLGDDPLMAQHFPKATHAQVLATHPAFEWCAVVDPAPEAQGRSRAKWDVQQVASDIAALEDAETFEVAVLAMPPGARTETVARLPGLRAVLVEKPLGRTQAEAEAFLSHCRARSIAVQVNYWRRGAEGFRELAAGGLVEMVGGTQAIFALYGNGLLNNGSHLIDFTRMLFGEVVAADPIGGARPAPTSPIAGDIETGFALGFAGGAMVTAQAIDFARYREVGLDVWGETGRLSILQESLTVHRFPVVPNRGLADANEVASDKPEVVPCPVGSAFTDLYTNLAEAVSNGAALWSPGESALVTEDLVHRIASAADTPIHNAPAG